MNIELQILCDRILSALFNGVYQGIILVLIVWVGFKLFPRANAATRYAVRVMTLLVVTALPLLHFAVQSGNRLSKNSVGADSVTSSSSEKIPRTLVLKSAIDPRREVVSFTAITPFEFVENLPVLASLPWTLDVPVDSGSPDTAVATRDVQASPLFGGSVAKSWIWQPALPWRVSLFLAGAWGLIAAYKLVRLGLQYLCLLRMKREGTAAESPLNERFESLRNELGIRRPISLRITGSLRTPVLAGFLRPVVLLPEHTLEESGDSEVGHLLRHELAHARRFDDWSNLVQQLIRAVFFFHPAIGWLSTDLTTDREIACDDHVIAALNRPTDYALMLTEFAGRSQSRDWAAAPAAWSQPNQLKKRITMILDSKRDATTRLARSKTGAFTIATMIVAAIGLYSGPRLALAQVTESAPPTKERATDAPVDNVFEFEFEPEDAVVLDISAGLSAEVSEEDLVSPQRAATPSKIFFESHPVPVTARVEIGAPVHPVAPIPPKAAPAPLVRRPASPSPAPSFHGPAAAYGEARFESALERRISKLEGIIEHLVEKNISRKSRPVRVSSSDVFVLESPGYGSGRRRPSPDLDPFTELDVKVNPDVRVKVRAELAPMIAQMSREIEVVAKEAALAGMEQRRFSGDMNVHMLNSERLHADALRSMKSSNQAQRHALKQRRDALQSQIAAIEVIMERLERLAPKSRNTGFQFVDPLVEADGGNNPFSSE